MTPTGYRTPSGCGCRSVGGTTRGWLDNSPASATNSSASAHARRGQHHVPMAFQEMGHEEFQLEGQLRHVERQAVWHRRWRGQLGSAPLQRGDDPDRLFAQRAPAAVAVARWAWRVTSPRSCCAMMPSASSWPSTRGTGTGIACSNVATSVRASARTRSARDRRPAPGWDHAVEGRACSGGRTHRASTARCAPRPDRRGPALGHPVVGRGDRARRRGQDRLLQRAYGQLAEARLCGGQSGAAAARRTIWFAHVDPAGMVARSPRSASARPCANRHVVPQHRLAHTGMRRVAGAATPCASRRHVSR